MVFQWTDEAIASLRQMLDEKMTFRDVAAALGCSRNAAIGKAHRLGLCSTSPKPGPHRKGMVAVAPKPKRIRVPAAPKVIKFPVEKRQEHWPVAPYVEGEGVELLSLEARHCRWPLGPKMQVAIRFCGHDKRVGSSYCDHHHRLSYSPVPRKNVVELPSVKREQRKSGLALRFEVGRI